MNPIKRYLFYFTCVLFLGIFLSGCSKNDSASDPQQSNFSLDQPTVSVPEGSSVKVKITAPAGTVWKVTAPTAYWLTASPLSGTGNGEITLNVTKFTYREKRVTNVSVLTEDTKINASSRSLWINVTDAILNTAPVAPVKAVYPVNGAKDVSEAYLRLQWSDSVDPDGDRITYTVEYSTDQKSWTKSNQYYETPSCTIISRLTGNTTYYWRVVAKDIFGAESPVSAVFSFTTAAQAGTWKDGEVRLYQDNGNGSTDAFTLIVTGDGFASGDMVPAGDWENRSLSAINALFENAEPYKAYRSYVRVYRIAAISPQSGVSQHLNGDQTGICQVVVKTRFGSMYDNVSTSAWTGLFDKPSPSTGGSLDKVFNWTDSCLVAQNIHVVKNYAVLVLQNVSHYNGTVNYFWDSGKNRTMGFVCNCPGASGTQTGFENVIVHEIGGHAIGHLADLYMTSPIGTLTEDKRLGTLEFQTYGWYQNVDVSGNASNSPWARILNSPEYSAYYSNVGYFEGARSVGHGIWRAESDATCMNDNRFYYDAASRYAIVNQLKAAAGETLKWADFVNKDYDHGNAIVTKSASVPYNGPMLPEPIIWKR